MFDLNPNLQIKEEYLQGTVIYSIDDFYLYPEEIEQYLFDGEIPLHLPNPHEKNPSYNNIHFEDRRLIKEDSQLVKVVNFLSSLCYEEPDTFSIVTNMQRFSDHEFNDYKECIWWPHKDFGYNGIVYFNKDDTKNGTALYDEYNTDDLTNSSEHYTPWRSKKSYKILKVLEPKYNRLVFFDGYKFLHGANIINNHYFGQEYRKNQVFFFRH